jgi:excisionase family DNA binding protein
MTEPKPNPTLTSREVAERLGVTPDTVRSWYRRGYIPAMRAGQRPLLFDFEAVTEALRERADRTGGRP